jgi:hypothetical protein
MEFVSMRELTAAPKETYKKLAANGELVVTNNGKPAMLAIDISNRDFIKLIDDLRRIEAANILHDIQTASVQNGTDNLSMDEIDAEIAVYRHEKRNLA